MPIDRNILIAASGQHPARTMDFDSLYTGLMQEVALGNVSVTKNDTGELELFNYTPQCQFDGNWNVFSLISRGLILCPSKKIIVCTGLLKFFNFLELGHDAPNSSFSVTEKLDGSCGLGWFWDGDWQVSTRGSFQSEQAKWAKAWLDANVNKSALTPGDTYIAEIIYPENRIVVPYSFEGLVLITAYDTLGYELPYGECASIAEQARIRHVKQRNFSSIEEIVKICETLPANEEGFVVRFDSGYRLKIKATEYLRLHRLINNVKPIYIWECLLNGDNLDEFLKQLPEEMRTDFTNIRTILEKKFDALMEELRIAHEKTKDLSDKELGLAIKEMRGNPLNDKILTPFAQFNLFLVRKKNMLENAYVSGHECRKRVFANFYPKGNKLDGFIPSNAMNRFAEEET